MASMYHWHPAYNHYPVVNISYHSAKAYSNWLTEEYNQNQKRKFEKVRFRLPSEEEWIKTAAPLPGHYLPWYGIYGYNEKGEYLANIKFGDYTHSTLNNYAADGGFFMVANTHYAPNQLGLHDVIGNVSEMIDEEGKYKGGSWDNHIWECRVHNTQEYDVPDPRVGFRLFMEVEKE